MTKWFRPKAKPDLPKTNSEKELEVIEVAELESLSGRGGDDIDSCRSDSNGDLSYQDENSDPSSLSSPSEEEEWNDEEIEEVRQQSADPELSHTTSTCVGKGKKTTKNSEFDHP